MNGPDYEDEDDYAEQQRQEAEELESESREIEADPYSDDEKEQMGDNDQPWLPN